MTILWRISNYADLSGRGGLVAPGRWHEMGTAVVYCCDHPSTALLETLVQVSLQLIPETFQLLRILAPDDLPLVDIAMDQDDFDDIHRTRSKGSKLLQSAEACLIRVPSAIMPAAANILINPQHPRAHEIRIVDIKSYPFDSRLLQP
ncbi:RES family NAD+ phosphorylase [Rhizobium sp. HT1-10]|uniref:RES family NAD+ phosphorylase n=1 Tax=Rhizobium sp. HT1-10 TaxID=3111638 RepID=UPI003C15D367